MWCVCKQLNGDLIGGTSETGVTILQIGLQDTLALGEGDPRLALLADNHGVLETGGEGVAVGILDVDNLERTRVTLTVHQSTDAANIVTLGGHDEVADFELQPVEDLAGIDIDADGVVGLDLRVREADGAAIVGTAERVALLADGDIVDSAQLVGGLFGGDVVDGESALGVPDETEILLGLVDGDDIHKTGREFHVGADLAVNLDEALHDNHLNLLVGQGVLEAVTQQDRERKALAKLVGTGGRARGPDTRKLVEHPVGWRVQALHMLLGTASHGLI